MTTAFDKRAPMRYFSIITLYLRHTTDAVTRFEEMLQSITRVLKRSDSPPTTAQHAASKMLKQRSTSSVNVNRMPAYRVHANIKTPFNMGQLLQGRRYCADFLLDFDLKIAIPKCDHITHSRRHVYQIFGYRSAAPGPRHAAFDS